MTETVTMCFRGRARLIGDDIDTDGIIPARYCSTTDQAKLAAHCLEDAAPELGASLMPGDILVAGFAFGCGSSREAAVLALKGKGVAAIVARSFAGIFYRNAINNAVPVLECGAAVDAIQEGDRLEIDLIQGEIRNLDRGSSYSFPRPGPVVWQIFRSGGLLASLERPAP